MLLDLEAEKVFVMGLLVEESGEEETPAGSGGGGGGGVQGR